MDYLRIGMIVRPHGVRGMLKILPLTDDPGRFRALREGYLEKDGGYAPVCASEISVGQDAILLRLDGCDTREAAEALRNVYLCVDRAHAAKLPAGRYFVADLIGCAVTDTEGADYGRLTDVLETGANDVYEITGKRVLMVPALKKLLKEVNVEEKRVVFDADVLREVGFFAD